MVGTGLAIGLALLAAGPGPDDPPGAVFTGMGRLYSASDEFAKSLCAPATLQSGEYLFHYNRFGKRGEAGRVYPLFAYFPAVLDQDIAPTIRSCFDKESQCSQPTIKRGRTTSQIWKPDGNWTGPLIVVAAGVPERPDAPAALERMKTGLLETYASWKLTAHSHSALQSDILAVLPPRTAHTTLQIVNPGECAGKHSPAPGS